MSPKWRCFIRACKLWWCVLALPLSVWAQANRQANLASTKVEQQKEWLETVMLYVIYEQRAFSWESLDDNHGHIVLSLNGKNYEMRTGEQTVESKNAPALTAKCFKPINVADDIFHLRDPKQESWCQRLFKILVGGLADAAIDDSIERAVLRAAVKAWLGGVSSGISILAHLLEAYNAYTTVERATLALEIQGYLNSPSSEAEIKSRVSSLEFQLRELNVNLPKAIRDLEAHRQAVICGDGTERCHETPSAKELSLKQEQHWLHGRPECFAMSH
jgi:hypothetical protein